MASARWLPPGTEGFERLGEYVDVHAEEGQVLLFNFLVMHGTGGSGPRTRISADLRFFPFVGILDSVGRLMVNDLIAWTHRRLETVTNDTLAAPLYDVLASLGQPIDWPYVERHSVLSWARLLETTLAKDSNGVRHWITNFANTETGFDPLESYLERYSSLRFEPRPYQAVLPALRPDERLRAEKALAGQRESAAHTR